MTDPLLADLDPEQLAAVTDPRVPLAIVAPAGSGKTRVLTRRIAYRIREGDAEDRHVLALTFTRKAAGELRDRLRMLGGADEVTAGTFHATALAQLRADAAERRSPPPVLLEHKGRMVAGILGPAGRRRAVVDATVAEIEWAQARMIRPEEYVAAAGAAGRTTDRDPGAIAESYARFVAEKRNRRVLDFDDLLRSCAERIARDPVFAEQQRFRFRHFFFDEFQDATPLQLALLRAWIGDRTDLTVVGDPAQSIYAFAGADASPLHEFGLVFPGGTTVALVRNHRATSAVVGLAEVALGPAGGSARIAPAAERGRGP
ncbi:MAG: UvrD-helicase domain-containing protein, partial [Actinomycetota bacterium]